MINIKKSFLNYITLSHKKLMHQISAKRVQDELQGILQDIKI